MHIAQIAEGVRNLLLHTKPETFIFDLLTAKASFISRGNGSLHRLIA